MKNKYKMMMHDCSYRTDKTERTSNFLKLLWDQIQGSKCQITIHTAGALKLLLEELHWDLDWTKHTKINSSHVVDDVYIHIDGMSGKLLYRGRNKANVRGIGL